MLWTHTLGMIYPIQNDLISVQLHYNFSFANMLRPFFQYLNSHHALFCIRPPDQTNHRYLKESSTGCVPYAGVPEERPCFVFEWSKEFKAPGRGILGLTQREKRKVLKQNKKSWFLSISLPLDFSLAILHLSLEVAHLYVRIGSGSNAFPVEQRPTQFRSKL